MCLKTKFLPHNKQKSLSVCEKEREEEKRRKQSGKEREIEEVSLR